MKPVIVEEGSSPLILGMPHVGQHLPDDIKERLNLLGQRVDDTDWWIDDLYKGLVTSPTVVKATFSRYVIDGAADGRLPFHAGSKIGSVPQAKARGFSKSNPKVVYHQAAPFGPSCSA